MSFKATNSLIKMKRKAMVDGYRDPSRPERTSWHYIHGKRFIYFAHNVEHDLIKIGLSINPEQRVKTLQCDYGMGFTLLGLIPGVRIEHEKMIHDKFKKHLAIKNEIFYADSEIWKFIKFLFANRMMEACIENGYYWED